MTSFVPLLESINRANTKSTMATTTRKAASSGKKKTVPDGGRSSRDKPPLPGQGAKGKAVAKASRSAVTAANKTVVDKQVATEAPEVAVKKEPMPKRRVFTEEEAACICKAWVNISEDPVTGAG